MNTRLLARGRARPSEPIVVTPDPIAAARSDVERLHRAELSLADRRIALMADLTAAEADAGDAALRAVLDGGDTSSAIGQVAMLRAEAEAVDRAIEAARRQRREAIPAVWRAEAAPLRERAAELRREADERQARTDELLRQLQEHEGCVYVVEERFGSWARVDGALLPDGVAGYRVPRTQVLLQEAASLEAAAAALFQRVVSDRGAITDAAGSEDLIARIRAWDPMTIAPALSAVVAWATEVETAQRARIARQPSQLQDQLRVSLYFVWTDGAIDMTRSGGRVVGLDR